MIGKKGKLDYLTGCKTPFRLKQLLNFGIIPQQKPKFLIMRKGVLHRR
jgi:hypothetical protein